MNPSVFDNFKNENLSTPLIVLKRIGQVSFGAAALGFVIFQFNGGQTGGNALLDSTNAVAGYGLLLGIVCFAIVGLVALGRGSKKTSTAHAAGRSLKKIFLYMYLPAIIITILLTLIFILPRGV